MQESKDARPKDAAKGDVRPPDEVGDTKESTRKDEPAKDAAKGDGPALRTPAEWAEVFGHTDPTFESSAKPGEVYVPKQRPQAGSLKRWIFLATAAHEGWGTKLPIDGLITSDAYEKAVASAMDLPLGEHHRDLAAEEKARAEAARKEKSR